MKHLEVRQKYSAARRISSELYIFSVFHLVMKHSVSCLTCYLKVAKFSRRLFGGPYQRLQIFAPLRSGAISKSGSSANMKALFPVVLTRIFPNWSMSKVEKAVKRPINRKVKRDKSNPKIYTVSKLRAMVKGRSTERATIKKASRLRTVSLFLQI